MKNKYLISVIIPLYNAGRYLDEAVESLVNQTIGFKNIEVIIINDGSTDNSEEYALKLKDKYKDNIVYVKKKNEGVSIARNTGLELATGKYINFLDADDKWGHDAFEKAIKILEENEEIAFVSVRRKKFELENDYTQFDYMFNEDKQVNIFDNYDYIQVPCTSEIIRSPIAKKYRFDKNLILSEDAKYMFDLCMNEKTFYILSTSLFYYRIRESNDSALQRIQFKKIYYSFTSKNVYDYALNLSKNLYNEIIPYAQYFVMYHLRWRFYIKPKINLTKKEEKEHINYLIKLIKQIDDDIILKQRRMTVDNKIHVLNIKYNKNIEDKITYKNQELLFNDMMLDPYNEGYIKILNISEYKNKFVIRGIILTSLVTGKILTFNDNEINLSNHNYDVLNYFKEYSPKYSEFIIKTKKCKKITFKLNNKALDLKYNNSLIVNNKLINYDIITNVNNIEFKKCKNRLSIKQKILHSIFKGITFNINKSIKLNKISKLHLLYTNKVKCNNPTMKTLETLKSLQKNIIFKNTYKEFITKSIEAKEYINKNINNFIIK